MDSRFSLLCRDCRVHLLSSFLISEQYNCALQTLAHDCDYHEETESGLDDLSAKSLGKVSGNRQKIVEPSGSAMPWR